MRIISRFIRHLKSLKERSRILDKAKEWSSEQSKLPAYKLQPQTLLIIRLDDIGDYLLFQNFIDAYNQSNQWKGWKKFFLGNIVWKPLFERWNNKAVDDVIWVDKRKYLSDDGYRFEIWRSLREHGFDVVICPSRTRPLLLDDMCAHATGSLNTIGNSNTLIHSSWNVYSDKLYKNILRVSDPFCHEFEFNRQFANWCCKLQLSNRKPSVLLNDSIERKNTIICFIGASNKSKRWPNGNWKQLIDQLQKQFNFQVFIAGGKDEVGAATEICNDTSAINIAGKKSLVEMVEVVSESKMVISNDTMAAHLAVCCQTPLVIIANGNNYYRFTDYNFLNSINVNTVYPFRFLNWRISHSHQKKPYNNVVSADMAGIHPDRVMAEIKKVMP